jgi:CBS domain-containing protein
MHDRISRILERKGRDVATTAPGTSVVVAVEHMNVRHIGSLVVVDGSRLTGILTERDVLMRVVAAGRDPRVTMVAEVMTPDPVIVRPDMTIGDAMRLITERRCRHLPVVDETGLCGLISSGDLTSWVVRLREAEINDLQDYIRAV